jgi:hypothetical protein
VIGWARRGVSPGPGSSYRTDRLPSSHFPAPVAAGDENRDDPPEVAAKLGLYPSKAGFRLDEACVEGGAGYFLQVGVDDEAAGEYQ